MRVAIFDPLGKQVATLVDEWRERGAYDARWDATGISSGVFYVRLQTSQFSLTKKVLLLR